MARFQHPSGMPVKLDNNQQDYATQINRALNLQSKPPGEVDQRVSLGIQLDDWTAPEFWTLRRGTRWQSYYTVGAVAGQKSFIQVRGSLGMLTVLERVELVTNPGSVFIYGLTAFEAAVGGGNIAPTDDRIWGAASPATTITSGSAVAPATGNAGYIIAAAGVMTTIPLAGGIVLTSKPNSVGVVPVWKLICNTANQGMDATFFFRERPILDSER